MGVRGGRVTGQCILDWRRGSDAEGADCACAPAACSRRTASPSTATPRSSSPRAIAASTGAPRSCASAGGTCSICSTCRIRTAPTRPINRVRGALVARLSRARAADVQPRLRRAPASPSAGWRGSSASTRCAASRWVRSSTSVMSPLAEKEEDEAMSRIAARSLLARSALALAAVGLGRLHQGARDRAGRPRHRARAAGRGLVRRAGAASWRARRSRRAGAADARAAGGARHPPRRRWSTTPSAPTPTASTRCSSSTASARARTGSLVETHDACKGAADRAPVGDADRAQRTAPASSCGGGCRSARSPNAPRSTSCAAPGSEAHARGVVCGGWMQRDDGTWEEKKC